MYSVYIRFTISVVNFINFCNSGGMVVLPSSVASSFIPNQLRPQTIANSPAIQPFVIRHGGVANVHDTGSQSNAAASPLSPRGMSGGATVHHLGSTDTKDSPFVHLRGHMQSSISRDLATASKQSSALDTVGYRGSSVDVSDSNDKPALKRIKLEVQDSDVTPYQDLYVDSHERDLNEIRASYQDHMTELFFLENGGNLMDYIVWSKRPNVHLNRLLQAESLDADVDCMAAGEEEKQINNEVSSPFSLEDIILIKA